MGSRRADPAGRDAGPGPAATGPRWRAVRLAAGGLFVALGWWLVELDAPPSYELRGEPRGPAPAAAKGGDAPPDDWLRQGRFVGAAACQSCHLAHSEGYAQTSHALTSRLPSEASLRGDFTGPGQRMPTRRPDVWFEMTRRDDGWYQTAFEGQPPRPRSERIDIVTGSGKLGQSFLSWRGNQLFQLPVSYLSDLHAWVNSPNYVDGRVWFDRPIVPRCLDCHCTWFDYEPGTTNTYSRTQFVLGVSCERCHGPGSEHLAWHQAHPGDKVGRAIANPVRLPRLRQMEICGQCHSAVGRLRRPAFSFRPGDALVEYVELESDLERARVALHSNNQLPRLAQSRCFQAGEELTCTTCHNPHERQRGDLASFSARCQRCHQPQACGMVPRAGARAESNCIDCHLSKVESISDITFNTPAGNDLAPLKMRDHLIRIDRELAQAVLAAWEAAESAGPAAAPGAGAANSGPTSTPPPSPTPAAPPTTP